MRDMVVHLNEGEEQQVRALLERELALVKGGDICSGYSPDYTVSVKNIAPDPDIPDPAFCDEDG